jgi:hypothetical protein
MVDWLYFLLVGITVAVGAFLLLSGLFGLKPKGSLILLISLVELGLLVQLAVSIGMALAGQQAQISTIEFFGYLLVALLIPPGAVIWSLAEPSRWATVVMGFASLTVAIMLVRMQQIWTGIPFGS